MRRFLAIANTKLPEPLSNRLSFLSEHGLGSCINTIHVFGCDLLENIPVYVFTSSNFHLIGNPD